MNHCRTHLKWLGVTLLVQLMAIALFHPPMAAAAVIQQAPGVSDSRTVTVMATVVAIDRAKQLVTLRGPNGNDTEVYADKNVRRFDELKVGDTVTATYSVAIAVRVRKSGLPGPVTKPEKIVRQKDSLAATITREQNVTVTVREINVTDASLSVVAPDGRHLDFLVEDKRNIQNLKVGDKVDVTYTEALLVRADHSPKDH